MLPKELSYLSPIVVDNLRRYGRNYDGGYVLPEKVVSKSDYLISFGISHDWSFENCFRAHNKGVTVLAFDHTIGAKYFFKVALSETFNLLLGRASLRPTLWRWKILLSYLSSFRHMKHYKNRVVSEKQQDEDRTIVEIFAELSRNASIFLKMDIEGTEYEVIPDIMRYSSQIVGMVIEFHDIGELRERFETSMRSVLSEFEIVHIHGNNWAGVSSDGLPNGMEITFLRHNLCPTTRPRRMHLPLDGLDQPCRPGYPDIPITFWS